jgi:hypothetical protein
MLLQIYHVSQRKRTHSHIRHYIIYAVSEPPIAMWVQQVTQQLQQHSQLTLVTQHPQPHLQLFGEDSDVAVQDSIVHSPHDMHHHLPGFTPPFQVWCAGRKQTARGCAARCSVRCYFHTHTRS